MCLGWWVEEAHLLSIFCNINAYIFVAEEKKKMASTDKDSSSSSGTANVYQLPSSWEVREVVVLFSRKNAALCGFFLLQTQIRQH